MSENKLQKIAQDYVSRHYEIDEGYVSIKPWFDNNDFSLDIKTIDKFIYQDSDSIYEAIDEFIFEWEQQIDYDIFQEYTKQVMADVRADLSDELTIAEYDEVKSIVGQFMQVDMSEAYNGIMNHNSVNIMLINYQFENDISLESVKRLVNYVGRENKKVVISAMREFGEDYIICVNFGLKLTLQEYVNLLIAKEQGKMVTVKKYTALDVTDQPNFTEYLAEDVTVNLTDYEIMQGDNDMLYYAKYDGEIVIS